LVTALVVSIAALAFFLGRESRKGEGAPSAWTTPRAASHPAPAVPPEASGPASSNGEPLGQVSSAEAESPAPAPETQGSTAPPAPGSPEARLRDEVARYFRDVEAIEAGAKYWSDPMALANSLLEQAASGDASGLQRLVSSQQAAAERLRRMN